MDPEARQRQVLGLTKRLPGLGPGFVGFPSVVLPFPHSAAARRVNTIPAVHIAAARSAAIPMATNGSCGYASLRGGFNGAGRKSSRGFSTVRIGTTMLRKTTFPTRPLTGNGRGSNVRMITREPRVERISY